jgi:phosphoserine phosphatase RsbU/P
VPLASGGQQLGQMYFNWHTHRRRFEPDEVEFVRQAGANASAMLQTSRLLDEQRRIATTLQENLIHSLPSVDGLELAARSLTAREPELVGGDFTDAFVLGDGRVVVVIGDVAGKGIRAAGLTETVRSTIRAIASIDSAPTFILRKTNELLLRHEPDEPHVTALVAVVDVRTGRVDAASAGHPAPVHLSPLASRLLEVPFGPPLGVIVADYVPARVTMDPDDCLVLYTDGVTEARRGQEFFGDERLVEVVGRLRGHSADEVADAVTGGALAFAGQLHDDLQVLVLRLA